MRIVLHVPLGLLSVANAGIGSVVYVDAEPQEEPCEFVLSFGKTDSLTDDKPVSHTLHVGLVNTEI